MHQNQLFMDKCIKNRFDSENEESNVELCGLRMVVLTV